jgi:hypothetical protein
MPASSALPRYETASWASTRVYTALLGLAGLPLTAISDKDTDVLGLCHGTGTMVCLVVVASNDRFETVVCRVLP